jgi:hypothetical protein
LATATKPRRRTAKGTHWENGSNPQVAPEFAFDSLEAELSAIGRAVPIREWAKVPAERLIFADSLYWGPALHPVSTEPR